jgi:CheY-like chemotaxis protein
VSAGEGPLVLVVDDFEDARILYGEYLAFCGYRVADAVNGEEAIRKAVELQPDLILMDLSMPLIDGWEATRRLKADPRTRGIRIMALTGHAMAAHAESARQAGCDVVVTKPCLPQELARIIGELLVTPDGEPRARPQART